MTAESDGSGTTRGTLHCKTLDFSIPISLKPHTIGAVFVSQRSRPLHLPVVGLLHFLLLRFKLLNLQWLRLLSEIRLPSVSSHFHLKSTGALEAQSPPIPSLLSWVMEMRQPFLPIHGGDPWPLSQERKFCLCLSIMFWAPLLWSIQSGVCICACQTLDFFITFFSHQKKKCRSTEKKKLAISILNCLPLDQIVQLWHPAQ